MSLIGFIARAKPSLPALVLMLLGGSAAHAQVEDGTPAHEPASQAVLNQTPTDSDRFRSLLTDVRDHVFSFDHPAFYRIRELVAADRELSKYEIAKREPPTPWGFLLERPSDYRGSLVMVEGLLLSKTSYEVPNRPDAGPYHECHLGQAVTRAICTVVLTEDPADIPLHATVRTKGYFILARAFENKAGETGSGPLLVARRLELHGPPAARAETRSETRLLKWAVGGTAVLAVIWLALRRYLQRSAPGEAGLRTRRAPGESQRDFEWLLEDSARQDDEGH